MVKQSVRTLKVQVIHLDSNNNGSNGQNINEEMCKSKVREIGRSLLKLGDELIIDLDLSTIDCSASEQNRHSSLKNCYQELLYQLAGPFKIVSMSHLTKHKNRMKEILQMICQNERFRNTWFGLIDVLSFLSSSEKHRLEVPRQVGNSFGLGTIIDLTTFVEHYSSNTDMKLPRTALVVPKDDTITDFQFDKDQLIVKFRLKSFQKILKADYKNIHYKFEVQFRSISSAIVSVDKSSMKIYFNLSHPPILFKLAADDTLKVNNNSGYYMGAQNELVDPDSRDWIRDNEFYGCSVETIGKCTVLWLEYPCIRDKSKEIRNPFDPYDLLFLMARFSKIPIYFAHMTHHKGPDTDFINKQIGRLVSQVRSNLENSFPIEYAIQSVFSFNYKCSDELFFKKQLDLFIENVIKFSKSDSNATEEALFELRRLNDNNTIHSTLNDFTHLFNDLYQRKSNTENIDIKSFTEGSEHEIVSIRRCILTPTRLILLEPEPSLKSRFIKENDPDFTIRLSIREDNLQNLQFSIRNLNDKETPFLHKIIKNPLKSGIKIGDRLFEFLGSSQSQLRDTGMIMYAKDLDNTTAEMIRESIGDMSKDRKNAAKYAARLGLAFSQVMTHIVVPRNQTEVIDDIVIYENKSHQNIRLKPRTKRNVKYNFSDGIGRVSAGIMQKVYAKLKLDPNDEPSAMQIRYGGVKGMLALDPNLEGDKIIFREEMVKYKSKDQKLGVIKLSAPRPLYLNRPFITILDQLGVESKVFLKMLMDDLKNLSDAMMCECHAIKLLQTHCSSSMGIPYRKLYSSGIEFLQEPLFRTIIDSVVNHRLKELKAKARIKIPMNCGRTVFGVLDESVTLEYGQVFVQVSIVDQNNKPCGLTILEGEILVTKFPCLHPGDVRKLKAIDVKDLHHHKDCIVFPQKGHRPHPNEMAGSDLDGDEYAVIWDDEKGDNEENIATKLIFKGDNKEPMEFPKIEAIPLRHVAQVDDILEFYCRYIVLNNVGLIANAHLANADREKEGIFSPVCMSLAEKYAMSLDFAKSGTIKTMDWNEKPNIYPDFMEKFSRKRTYLSKKTLGQLYRLCDRYGLGVLSNSSKMQILVEPNNQLLVEDWEPFTDWAKTYYSKYKMRIDYLLNRFGVDNEAILLSGSFSKTSKYINGKSETNDVHELLMNIVGKLFADFRHYFNADSPSEKLNRKERHQRAYAWYMMPFIEQEGHEPRYGFSWIITEELCNIAEDKSNASKDEHECQQTAIRLIDNYLDKNYLYREPNTDQYEKISDKRQSIMEERWQTSRKILEAWLERQDHLFFKRRVNGRLISSTDYQISDMQQKLKRALMRSRVDLLAKARDDLNWELKTVGQLVMDFLRESLNAWQSINHLDQNNRIVDTPMVKLGFSALITIHHLFKTGEISHIVRSANRFQIALKAPIYDETFYIPLPTLPTRTFRDKKYEDKETMRKKKERTDMLNKYVEYMVQCPEVFCDKLKRLSGALDIYLEPYRSPKKQLEHYYLMTVTGTVWSIQAVKNFVCHPAFFRVVANSDRQWKRNNLFCR